MNKVFFAVLVSVSLSACGVSTPGGYVLGTTGYLEEYNTGRSRREPLESVTESDRRQLSQLTERSGS